MPYFKLAQIIIYNFKKYKVINYKIIYFGKEPKWNQMTLLSEIYFIYYSQVTVFKTAAPRQGWIIQAVDSFEIENKNMSHY